MEEALSSSDEFVSAKEERNTSKSSSVSCYQSASDCSCDWSRDVSPERPCMKDHKSLDSPSGTDTLEQLDMKPMEDFRDYVNLTPTTWTPPRLSSFPVADHNKYIDVPSIPSDRNDKLYLNTSSGHNSTIGGLSPNSSEDSGFGTGLRVWTPSEVRTTEKLDEPLVSKHVPYGARFRNSICYARSASCDSLFWIGSNSVHLFFYGSKLPSAKRRAKLTPIFTPKNIAAKFRQRQINILQRNLACLAFHWFVTWCSCDWHQTDNGQ